MFDNCLEVFKLENSAVTLTATHFDLRNLLNELYELFQPTCVAKGLTFTIRDLGVFSAQVIGNRPSIYRVLLNLIGNAVKFTHSGSITVSFKLNQDSAQQPTLLLYVDDTGIGIPSNKLDTIFERFMRITPSYKGIYEGSGIGLYIVQKSVLIMGGIIKVESEEGKGSKFTVEQPIQIP